MRRGQSSPADKLLKNQPGSLGAKEKSILIRKYGLCKDLTLAHLKRRFFYE